MLSHSLIIAALLMCLIPLAASASGGLPPLFDRRPYSEAKQAAESAGKWFIVKATAEWCSPCKKMDATTWVDDSIIGWFAKFGIAVALDVDREYQLARELEIQFMPTVIAFKDRNEFDRIVGYKRPEELMVWLDAISRGERAVAAPVRRTAADGLRQDIDTRWNRARALLRSGDHEEATRELVWLWSHALEHAPSRAGVRVSFWAGSMGKLAAKHAPALRAFTALRDELTPAIKHENAAKSVLKDWLTLNRVIGDAASTVAWYDTVRSDNRWTEMIAAAARDLEEPLLNAGRWADLGRVYADPLRSLAERHHFHARSASATRRLIASIPPEFRVKVLGIAAESLRKEAGMLYGATLAAGREEVAAALASQARLHDDSPAMLISLVSAAITAKQPRSLHREWLSALDQNDPEVTRLLKSLDGALGCG